MLNTNNVKKIQDKSLSIIIPTYNNRVGTLSGILTLDKYLSRKNFSYEIIIVDDGSNKNERLKQGELPEFAKLLQIDINKGKGAAVKLGIIEAKGDCRIFTDIDMPYDLSAIEYSYNLIIKNNFDFVAGDRTLFHSSYKVKLPWIRKVLSKFFSKIITLFVIGGIFDSQCGFKAFSGSLAKILFPLLKVNSFAFDVEIYYLLLKYNILIKRIPVRLCNQEGSTINIFKHGFEMIWDILQIPPRWYRKKYFSEQMKTFKVYRYWD